MGFKIKRKESLLTLVLLGIFILYSASVFGANTRLNITMFESVTQNVSFAKDFDLVETQDYCRITGVLNITNPTSDTIFNTFLTFVEIEKLETDIYWVAGREGNLIYGGAGVTTVITGNIGNNTNNYTLPVDLDNDEGLTDYVWNNGTHMVFNLSSEAGLIYVNLSNSTTNPVSIAGAATNNVPLQMNQVNITGSSRVIGNITITGSVKQNNLLNGSDLSITIIEKPESPVVIHIPELRGGNYTTFNYNMSCMGREPPVDIQTIYANNLHPTINKKVLAGYNWTINQTVYNNNIGSIAIGDLNISMTAAYVDWNDSSFYFTLDYLYPLGDSANVHGNGTSNTSWWWAPDGGSLPLGENKSILFTMIAPRSVPYSLTYLALTERISYSGDYLMSNLTLTSVNASADLEFTLDKRISQPADNLNDSRNVTWEIRPRVTVPINVTYSLNKVTLWVTYNYDPANYTWLSKNYTGADVGEVNLTTPWGNSTYYWYFNYTDGSNTANPPPIVWIQPEWLIANKYGQIVNYSNTINDNDIYMKYIYVVNGYWLEIQKNITSIGEGQYQIYTYVENIGNGWTPEFEKVTVYDFVPNEFAPYNWSVAAGSNDSVGTVGSAYYGTAFVWDIPWKAGMNSSLGPKNGPEATVVGNYSWNITYMVNGSGAYKATELYIVGLDPLKVDGASASPIITVIAGIKSHSTELLYIFVVAFLVVVNIINLVMTNRINKKLNQRLPPAPAPRPMHQHNNNNNWQ